MTPFSQGVNAMKRLASWIIYISVFALLVGCADASNYIKESYPLVNVQGSGKATAKVYSVEGKDVPTVAKEIAAKDKPKEISKESPDQMFLVYNNSVVNIHKDPNKESDTLAEIDTIEYAKQNYDSSFLQGYITASLLQSLFGRDWSSSRRGYQTDYRGYTPPKTSTTPNQSSGTPSASKPSTPAPTTTDRKGSFGSTPSTGTSSPARKSDGSTPTYKAPSKSKPSTSKKSGSFTKRR
jgi:hypothetical protein